MHTVADILIIAIIGFCIWQGYKRGVLGSIVAVVFIIISIYAANLAAGVFGGEFNSMFRPFISGYLDSMEREAVEEVVPRELQGRSTEDIFRIEPWLEPTVAQQVFIELGVHESRTEVLADRYLAERDRVQDISFNHAMTEVTVYAFTFLLIYIIAFLLILITLTVLYNIIHLSFKLPSIRLVDDIGGGLFGLLQGLLLVFMLAWMLGYMGILFPEDFIAETSVLEFFIRGNVMGPFINL